MSTPMPGRERSVAELMADLARESSDLVQKEIELAKLETLDKLNDLKKGLGAMAAAGVIAFAGLLLLLHAAAIGLDLVIMRPWLSYTIVGGSALILGVIALLFGRSQVSSTNLKPDRSMESLRRDGETIARHVGAS
jgi:hypothetical protein